MPYVLSVATCDLDAEPRTNPTALPLAVSLSTALHHSWDYEQTVGKRLAWTAFMATITNITQFKVRASLMGYLSTRATVMKCDHGVAIVTHTDLQVNVNHVIPMTEARLVDLLSTVVLHVDATYPGHTVSLEYVLRQVPRLKEHLPLCIRYRRLVMGPEDVRKLTLMKDGTLVGWGRYVTPVISVCGTDALRSGKFRPIARASVTDDKDTLYWHSFSCGSVVVFHNPSLPLIEPITAPTTVIGYDALRRMVHEGTTSVILEAMQPVRLDATLAVLAVKQIPAGTRKFFFMTGKAKFGMSDTLVQAVANAFADDDFAGHDDVLFGGVRLSDARLVGMFVTQVDPDSTPASVLAFLRDLFVRMRSGQEEWVKWALSSPFVYSTVRRAPAAALRVACARYRPFRTILTILLHDTIGHWTALEVEQAAVVGEHDTSTMARQVRAELARVRNDYDVRAAVEGIEGDAVALTPSPVPLCARGTIDTAVELPSKPVVVEASAPASLPPLRTHHALTRRLEAELGLPCTLIGSGIFSDMGDVDVVITLGAGEDLAAAYERVRVQTGWRPCYSHVDGSRVAVLAGTHEGVAVDAQLWRGVPAATLAERATQRAVDLARRLNEGADEAMRVRVRALHRLLGMADLKGHTHCRLPGVAVTCMAILLSCRLRDVLELSDVAVLETLRDVLAHEVPRFDFDAMVVGGDEDGNAARRARPNCAVAVVVDEVNVASRMTACTTRHLLDTVAAGVVELPLTSEAFAAWRRRVMFPLAYVRPRAGDASVSRTLHMALATLDGNPVVESVHVTEDGDDLVILGTLCTDDPTLAERYGFRTGDAVVVSSARHVIVRRTGGARGVREWPLACVARPGGMQMDECASVADLVAVEHDVCVPNAPCVTVDVLACFDRHHWEWRCE